MMSLHGEHLFFQRITFVKREEIKESYTHVCLQLPILQIEFFQYQDIFILPWSIKVLGI